MSALFIQSSAEGTTTFSRMCAEKYLRDALGNKGTKYLDRLVASNEAFESPMTKKVAKLFYIIFRLLFNARYRKRFLSPTVTSKSSEADTFHRNFH